MTFLLIGLGAGLASALLFAVVTAGSPLAVALSLVAPLPILIAALGWKHRAGLVAMAAGGLAIAVAFRPAAGLAFALGWALPAWWLAYLALLGRSEPDGAVHWFPLGRLLLWIGGTAAAVAWLGVVSFGSGDYGAYQNSLRRAVQALLRVDGGPAQAPVPVPGGLGAAEVIDGFIAAFPILLASSFALILTLNLWLAAKAVSMSGRLPRPWPSIPETAMPPAALLVLAGALAAAFLPGFSGAAGLAGLGALGVAFALQGFAALHDMSRGRSGRGFLLATAYALALLASQFILPLFALAGVADAVFRPRENRRPRIGRRPDP